MYRHAPAHEDLRLPRYACLVSSPSLISTDSYHLSVISGLLSIFLALNQVSSSVDEANEHKQAHTPLSATCLYKSTPPSNPPCSLLSVPLALGQKRSIRTSHAHVYCRSSGLRRHKQLWQVGTGAGGGRVYKNFAMKNENERLRSEPLRDAEAGTSTIKCKECYFIV